MGNRDCGEMKEAPLSPPKRGGKGKEKEKKRRN